MAFRRSHVTVTDPAPDADERTSLTQFLQAQRDLVAWKLADAEEASLLAVATPSGLTPLGVVRHLTAVERWWFRHRFAGQAGLAWDWTDEDPDGEMCVREGETLSSLLADYAAECSLSDAAAGGRSLDEVGADGRSSLRWVYLHLIEETARHLGHIDLLREQADGSVGSDPGWLAELDEGTS